MKLLQELNEMANGLLIYGECSECNSPMTVRNRDRVDPDINPDDLYGGWPNAQCMECGARGSFNPEHPDDAADREEMY